MRPQALKNPWHDHSPLGGIVGKRAPVPRVPAHRAREHGGNFGQDERPRRGEHDAREEGGTGEDVGREGDGVACPLDPACRGSALPCWFSKSPRPAPRLRRGASLTTRKSNLGTTRARTSRQEGPCTVPHQRQTCASARRSAARRGGGLADGGGRAGFRRGRLCERPSEARTRGDETRDDTGIEYDTRRGGA